MNDTDNLVQQSVARAFHDFLKEAEATGLARANILAGVELGIKQARAVVGSTSRQ